MKRLFHVEDGHLTRAYYPYERVVGAAPIGRGVVAAGLPNATCMVWHIAMSEVASFSPDMNSGDATPARGNRGPTTRDPVAVYRNRLAHLAGQVKTDFDLVGPPGCDAKTTQSFLRSIARILVREDAESRGVVCNWIKANIAASGAQCQQPASPIVEELPVEVPEKPGVPISCRRKQ
jgi:hypothetical protein